MKAEIEITKSQICELEVTGLEVANNAYSTEISDTNGEFTYLDTLVVNGLYKVDSNEEKVLKNVVISLHKQETIDGVTYNVPDSASFKLDEDGEYEIVHVIIPLKTWIDSYKETFNIDPTSNYSTVYVSDGVSFYQYDGTNYITIPVTTILENYSNSDSGEYSTVYLVQTTFDICKLENCLFKIESKLLHEYCPMKCNKETMSDLILKRDILWMAKNVITYLLEKGSFQEAQRIVEQFTACNNFCNDELNENGGSGCGCGSSN